MIDYFKRGLKFGSFKIPVWALMTVGLSLILIVTGIYLVLLLNQASIAGSSERLITIYDYGTKKTIKTHAKTIDEALTEADVEIDETDVVEPSLDSEIIASSYSVNIYRSMPAVVVDGSTEKRVVTAAQSGRTIALAAGIELYTEDLTEISREADILLGDGAIIRVEVIRAVPVQLTLYGQEMLVRTQARTVEEFLKEKDLTITENDRVNLTPSTPITADMKILIWREGKSTITVDEEINFETQTIQSNDRPIGYHAIETPGEVGKRSVTYEIEFHNGAEVGRTEIQSIVLIEPKAQVEVVGIKSTGGLTKSKGVYQFTDSKGVTHRETYYDLPMSTVMRNCGQGGYYTVRVDGVKVDRDGYVIIAANLNRYPRCSVIETSVGLGKVYDTGGFASTHPDGWDIATDWTNNNGI